jgi:hypothetical protein
VENLPQGKTRDIVAEQSGFGSGKQYEKAKYISENADAETIAKLDAGEITDALSSDINVITAEINSYKQIVGSGIYEIGIRLKKVRDENLADSKYGNWGRWLSEAVDFTDRQARRLIQVVEEFKTDDVVRIGSSKVFEIIQLPPEIDRQEFVSTPHTIPSTGEVKTVDEMTVRELREVKKALKEAQEAAAKAQERAQRAEEAVQQAKSTENKNTARASIPWRLIYSFPSVSGTNSTTSSILHSRYSHIF